MKGQLFKYLNFFSSVQIYDLLNTLYFVKSLYLIRAGPALKLIKPML